MSTCLEVTSTNSLTTVCSVVVYQQSVRVYVSAFAFYARTFSLISCVDAAVYVFIVHSCIHQCATVCVHLHVFAYVQLHVRMCGCGLLCTVD